MQADTDEVFGAAGEFDRCRAGELVLGGFGGPIGIPAAITIVRDRADPGRQTGDDRAIAMGHPLGATGAMLLTTVLDELERRDLKTAMITLCVGGGMGIATIIERV